MMEDRGNLLETIGTSENASPQKYRAFLTKVFKLTATAAGLLAVSDAFQKSPALRRFFQEAVRYGLYYAKRTVFDIAWGMIFKFPRYFKKKNSNTPKQIPPGFTSKTWSLLKNSNATKTSDVLVYWLSDPALWRNRPLTMVYTGRGRDRMPVAVVLMQRKISLSGIDAEAVKSLETFIKIAKKM